MAGYVLLRALSKPRGAAPGGVEGLAEPLSADDARWLKPAAARVRARAAARRR
jgi:hypothetical protein